MTLNMPYDEVVKRIIEETGLSKDEVIKKIENKVNELGSLITPEGAAHIIARELEINLYDSQSIKRPDPTSISQLIEGMNNVTITALVKYIFEPNNFSRKDGTQGAVQNIQLIDKTGFCRLVIWDDQIRQFNDMNIKEGSILRVSGAFVKENNYDGIKELNLSSRTQIDIDPKDIKKSDFPDELLENKKISDLKLGLTDISIIGKIIALRPISTFTKKDGTEGQLSAIELADETAKIKVTLWGDKAEIINNLKNDEAIEIVGGYTRQGLNDTLEIHLGKNGTIKKRPKEIISIPDEILNDKSQLTVISKKQDIPSEEVRLIDINETMKNISIIARITGISSIREFTKKDGSQSSVGSLLVKDNSAPGRVTLWNSMTDYIKQVEVGDVIRIENAYVRMGLRGQPEVHVSGNSIVEINPEYLKDAIPELELVFTDISSLKPNERDINVRAVIMRVQEMKTFTKNDGCEGQVLNIGISDNTGSTRVVAWDDKAIEFEHLEEMTPIEILHGYTKEGLQGVEIHLGVLSTLRKAENSKLDVKKIKSQTLAIGSQSVKRVDMIDLEEGVYTEIRGTILKIYEGKMYYYSCPECRKKIIESDNGQWLCETHNEVNPEISLFISVALDDGTGCIRATFFRDLAEQLLDIQPENIVDEIEQIGIQPVILKLEQRLKGREIIVRGKPKKNQYDDGMDLIVNFFSEFDPKEEIKLIKSSLET